MEHRVKQKSEEWQQLRKSITLTASQFASAVGVGDWQPFHFFLSLVQTNTADSVSSNRKGSCDADAREQGGAGRENVIKEAYELLTGLRVQETGFWVPNHDSPLHSLVGGSPDGLVVDESDTTRVLGLATFKSPGDNLYSDSAKCQGGIPRHCMVQVQGQMAVCGAPWCDFMAVCSKTREIMLRRIFFQPRYWEHVATRLKQFCFALQEAEIMRELGRDLASGSMAKRLQQQLAQSQLFPAEDIITVQNLLRNTGHGTFRGPSRKLLSFDILVGDVYSLPPTLSRYSQALLAKVDAEIRRKTPKIAQNGQSQNDGEKEFVCKRVFYGDAFIVEEERECETPERVFGEGLGVLEGQGERLSFTENDNGGDETSVIAEGMEVSETADISVSQTPNISARTATGTVTPLVRASAGTISTGSLMNKGAIAVSTRSDSSLSSSRASAANKQAVASTQPAFTAQSQATRGRPLQGRVALSAASSEATGRGQSVKIAGRGATSTSFTSNSPPLQSIRGRGRGRGLAAHHQNVPVGTSQDTNAPNEASQSKGDTVSHRQTNQAAKQQLSGKACTQSPVPRKIPRLSSSVRGGQSSVAPATTRSQAATTFTSAPTQNTLASSTASGGRESRKTMESAGRVDSASPDASSFSEGTSGQAKSTPSQTSSASVLVAARSARDEWEMSARRVPLRPRPLSGGDITSDQSSKTSEGENSQSQEIASVLAASRQKSPVLSGASSELFSAGVASDQDMGTQEVSSVGEEDRDYWRKEILKSSNEFVPPGLTITNSSGGCEPKEVNSVTDQASDKSPSKESAGDDTVSETASVSEQQTDSQSELASPQQPINLKRAAAQQDSRPAVEASRPMYGRSASSRSVEEMERDNEWSVSKDPESPRGQIHRPWLGRQDNLDPSPDRGNGGTFRERLFDRPPEAHSRERSFDRPPDAFSRDLSFDRDRAFDRPPEAHSRPFDGHDEGPISRSFGERQDFGSRIPDRGQPIRSLLDVDKDRGVPPMRPQFDLDLARGRDSGRVFDYDHNRRIRAEDFHRRSNPTFLPGQRQSALLEARSREFDDLRRNSLDLGGPSDLRAARNLLHRSEMHQNFGQDGSRGLDQRGGPAPDILGVRGSQLQGRWLPGRSELEDIRSLNLRPAHTNQGNFSSGPRIFGVPVRAMDRGFAGLDPRDPRGEWERGLLHGANPANPDFRGELGRGQGFRGFPPGRRPFEF